MREMLDIMLTISKRPISSIIDGDEGNEILNLLGGNNIQSHVKRMKLAELQLHRPSRSQNDIKTRITAFAEDIYYHEGYAKHEGSDHLAGGGAQPLSLQGSMNIAKGLLSSYLARTTSKAIRLLQV